MCRFKNIIFSAAMISASQAFCGDTFQYFDHPELDYWGEKKDSPQRPNEPNRPALPKETATNFPWKKYLDPKNEEFFKEGDYTPPAPFMEITRNPSDENIGNWFRYLELKNQLTHRLQDKLDSYASSHGMAGSYEAKLAPAMVTQNDRISEVDPKRFRLRLYFDSKCPHCEHMMGTLSELSKLGFFVELRQVDSDVSARGHIPFPVTSAQASELKQYGIQGVPLLLVGDLKRHSFFKIEGYQPTNAVLKALSGEITQKGDQS